MHYRSTHSASLSHRRTHTHICVHTFLFFLISLNLHTRSHATSQMMGFKHQQYEIFMCQCQPLEQNKHQGGFAFRSEDTTAFIPLSLIPKLSLSLSPVVLQHSEPLSRCCVPVCSWALFYFSVITPFRSQVFFVCLWLGGQRMTRPQPFLNFLFLAQNVGKVGEMDWLEIRTWGDDSEFERC